MKQIWRITLDRYGNKSIAKGGGVVGGGMGTLDELIEKCSQQKVPPTLEVVNIGIGRGFADMLEARGIPFTRVDGHLMRISGADVFKTKGNKDRGKWINAKIELPKHGDIVNIAGSVHGKKFVTLCKIDRECRESGEVWMDGAMFSGYEWEYDFKWSDVEYWQLAPNHPDL